MVLSQEDFMCQNYLGVAWGLTVLSAQTRFCLAGIPSTAFRTEATHRVNLRLLIPCHSICQALPCWGERQEFLVVSSVLLLVIEAALKVNICNCSKYKMTFVAGTGFNYFVAMNPFLESRTVVS